MVSLDALAGPFPVVPTPFSDDERLDLASLDRVLEAILGHTPPGLTLLGSSGEVAYLDGDERRAVAERALTRIGSRALKLCGVVERGTRNAVDEGKRMRDLGADALLVALPQYYRTPLGDVIRHLAAVRSEVGLPTLYYHYPDPTNLRLTPPEVGKLFAEVDLAGVKNSSLDTADTLAQIAAIGRPVRMFTGHSFDFLAALRGGAVGSICPVALLMPESAKEVAAAFRSGVAGRAETAQQRFFNALPFVMPEPQADGLPAGVPHAGVKQALHALGLLTSAVVRSPQPRVSMKRREQIRGLVKEVVELRVG